MVKHEGVFLAERIGSCPAACCGSYCRESRRFGAGDRKYFGKSGESVRDGMVF